MKKLNLDALKERAIGVASDDLLNTITGGVESSCHVKYSCDSCTVTIKGGTIIINP